MWIVYGGIVVCSLLGTVVLLARENGRKAAHLDALKRAAAEASHVRRIQKRVDRMPLADVYRRLHHSGRYK